MNKNQIAAICGEYLIDIGIALENDAVVAAVKAGDVAALRHALETQF